MGERSQYKMDMHVQQRAIVALWQFEFALFLLPISWILSEENTRYGETDSLQMSPFANHKANKQANKQKHTKKRKKTTLEQQEQTTKQNKTSTHGSRLQAFPEQFYLLTFRNTISLKSRLLAVVTCPFSSITGKE